MLIRIKYNPHQEAIKHTETRNSFHV